MNKPLDLRKYPVEYKGMKVRLFAKYINWFWKNVPDHSFDFALYHESRTEALSNHRRQLRHYDNVCNVALQYESLINRIDLQLVPTKTESNHKFCDTVGCFTGWGVEAPFIYEHTHGDVKAGFMPLCSGEFSQIVGIDKDISSFLFMPDVIPPVNGKEYDLYLKPAEIDITKDLMLDRVTYFLQLVMDNKIDPNPITSNNITNNITNTSSQLTD